MLALVRLRNPGYRPIMRSSSLSLKSTTYRDESCVVYLVLLAYRLSCPRTQFSLFQTPLLMVSEFHASSIISVTLP
jgi:hypothetical protein